MYDLPDDEAIVDPWIKERLTPAVMTYYQVPFAQRAAAKAAGARFDGDRKLWCLHSRDLPHPPTLVPYAVAPPAGAEAAAAAQAAAAPAGSSSA